MMDSRTASDRGQAYTLEGFISAMIVLMAVLFAMQSVVIAPTTGGLADRTVQAQIEQETQDALTISATAEDEQDLATLVRYWDKNESEDGGEFYNATDDNVEFYYDVSNESEFYNEFALGEILMDRFTERGLSYNVELVYQDEAGEFNDQNSTHLVYQGESEAVTTSYTVPLFESDNLTAPDNENTSLRDAYYCSEDADGNPEHTEDCYPIPPATDPPDEDDGSEIYNVVEVRVTVW